jgi:hypothetical protein
MLDLVVPVQMLFDEGYPEPVFGRHQLGRCDIKQYLAFVVRQNPAEDWTGKLQ